MKDAAPVANRWGRVLRLWSAAESGSFRCNFPIAVHSHHLGGGYLSIPSMGRRRNADTPRRVDRNVGWLLPSRFMSRNRRSLPQTPPGCDDAWQELRALHVGDEAGWFRYVAGELADGRHVVRLLHQARPYRTLLQGEPYWWVLGMGDGLGYGQAVDAIAAEPVPPLVKTRDAAGMIGLTLHGVVYLIHGGEMLPLYGARKVRYLFVAQCEAQRLTRHVDSLSRELADLARTAAPAAVLRTAQLAVDKAGRSLAAAVTRWHGIRSQLPAATRPVAVGVDLTPAPSPEPWPVPRMRPPAKRCIRALMIAEEQKWLVYVRPNPEGTFTIQVDDGEGGQLERDLPAAGVLPYVLGLADSRGQGLLVAYRDGLGY